ncbi:MAG: alpha/beta fold hydrolase [Candidatus Krumholzibacteriota bacterium]|nr:alpha/beta fold hydrolase [Candidatus Krumholzibacteriota bacterium]
MQGKQEKIRLYEKEIRISAPGGTTLFADLRSCAPEEPMPLIIISHGFLGYSRWGFFPVVSKRLSSDRFHTLIFDFSHNGTDRATGMITRPEEFAANTVSSEIADLEAVCRFAASGLLPVNIDRNRIGLLGHSRGGAVSLLVCSSIPGIRSLVTWSSPSNLDRYSQRRKEEWKRTGRLTFRDLRAEGELWLDYSYYEDIDRRKKLYDLPERASRLSIPYLIIHGRRDAAVTLREAQRFISREGSNNIRMEIIEGCGHTFGVRNSPGTLVTEGLEKAISLTTAWFMKTL